MKNTDFDDLWSDKKNWKYGIFYNCDADPRVIVPKKPAWMGRTLNFAHRKAYLVLLLTFVPILVVITYISQTCSSESVAFWVLLITIIAIVVFYYTHDLRVDKK